MTVQQHEARDRASQTRSRGTLRLDELSWHVGGLTVVDRVSLDVPAGQLLAVIGPNGAGKTSLFNLITGLIRPTGGTIRLDERDITRLAAHRRPPLGLGRTFQTSSVFTSMTVRDNVELAAQAALGGPYRALRIWTRIGAGARHRAADALDRTRMAGRADTVAGSLSHGEKRKLELAILLAGNASVVLLDEPMAGMAVEEVPELAGLIRDIHHAGTTVLMVEHHMEVVLGLAERVAVLHHGELIACGTAADVTADPTVRDAYMGEPL